MQPVEQGEADFSRWNSIPKKGFQEKVDFLGLNQVPELNFEDR